MIVYKIYVCVNDTCQFVEMILLLQQSFELQIICPRAAIQPVKCQYI